MAGWQYLTSDNKTATMTGADGVTIAAFVTAPIVVAWVNEGNTIAAAPASAAPVLTLTFLQFMALFTTAEQDAIFASADTQTKMFITMAAGSGGLQLNNTEVVGGVGYLATLGLITTARATAILAGDAP